MYLLTLSAHAYSEGCCSSPFHVYVCMYVCVYMCVHSNLPPHTLESQKKDTNRFIAIQESLKILPIFLKMLHSKVMALLPTSSSSNILALFPHEISFYDSFEAYRYVFTAQTIGL